MVYKGMDGRDLVEVVVIGHSKGGAAAEVMADQLSGTPYAVDDLVTLDPVGSKAGILVLDPLAEFASSRLADSRTYWVNCYNMELGDAIADIPLLPLVPNLLGGIVNLFSGGWNSGVAGLGDRQGNESGADENSEADNVDHNDPEGFMLHLLGNGSPGVRSLVQRGILK